MDQTIQRPPIKVEKAGKGKISRGWRNDAEILNRLSTVADMMLRGHRAHQIAAALDCSLTTAKRDIARVRTMWSEESRSEIETAKDRSIEQYLLVIERAWQEFESKKSSRFLSIIIEAQSKIDDIIGTRAPALLGVGDARTIDQIRNKRWNQVAGILDAVLKDDTYEITSV